MNKPEIVPVTLRLEKETAEDLQRIAVERNTFQSTIAEKAIRKELDRMEDK